MAIEAYKKKCIPFHNTPRLLCEEGIKNCNRPDKLAAMRYANIKKFNECTDPLKAPKIPPKLHLIWFTPEANPREISKKNLNTIKKSLKILVSDNQEWETVLWTNDESLIPQTATQLRDIGVSIKTLEEIEPISAKLKTKLYDLINDNFTALASDTTRYILLKNIGGVYMDVNYELYAPISKLMQVYDFFSGIVPNYKHTIEVTPLGSKPHHPVMEEAVSITERNLLNPITAPEYVQFPCNNLTKTYAVSGTSLSIAYYKQANKDGNVDIAFPGGVFSSHISQQQDTKIEIAKSEYAATHLQLFGTDYKENSWKFENDNTPLEYRCFYPPNIQDQLCYHNIVCDFSENTLQNLRIATKPQLGFKIDYSKKSKIPPKLHLIWFTSKNNPREISDKNIELIEQNIALFSIDKQEWETTLWTNNKALIPLTVSALSKAGVRIKTLEDIETIDSELKEKVYESIESKLFALASDAIRLVLLENYGGIYTDVDYTFHIPIRKLMQTYDFFAKEVPIYTDVLDVVPIASTAHHPVIQEAVRFIINNMVNTSNAPEFVQFPCDYKTKTFVTSSPVLSYAFYKYANINNNIDIVFPVEILHSKVNNYRDKLNKLSEKEWQELLLENYQDIPPIGNDNGDNSWHL